MKSKINWLRIIAVAVAMLFPCSVMADSGWFHVELPDDSPVPVSGYPLYIEDMTTGSPLSDFSSHVGIKASVRLDHQRVSGNEVPFDSLLNMAHYACWAQSRQSRQWDQSYLELIGSKDFTPENRRIVFEPWGWEETVKLGALTAIAQAMFIQSDTVMLRIKLMNNSDDAAEFKLRYNFFSDADDNLESSYLVSKEDDVCDLSLEDSGVAFLDCEDGRGGLRFHFLRKLMLEDFSDQGIIIEDVRNKASERLAYADSSEISLAAGKTVEVVFVVAYGRILKDATDEDLISATDLDLMLDEADSILSEGAKEAVAGVKERWSEIQSTLGPLHSASKRDTKLALMAQAALVNNLYEPTLTDGRLASLPAKVYHNDVRPWSTAFQALGISEFDSESAKRVLSHLFEQQEQAVRGAEGMLPARITDDGADFGDEQPYSTPPNQGFAIEQIFYADGAWDVEWLEDMYEASDDYLSFWFNQRDRDIDTQKSDEESSSGNGLYEYANSIESGWDDSVRYSCELEGNNVCEQFGKNQTEALDLNSWLYMYLRSMTRMARILDRPLEEQQSWSKKAQNLEERFESLLWNPIEAAYADRSLDDEAYVFSEPDTPAIVWPLFTGLSKNSFRVTSTINKILNRDTFWGYWDDETPNYWPIPTVAYDSDRFDERQDGYFRQGQIWPVTSYAVIQALYRYGYSEEAEALKEATLSMMSKANPGGLHDAYDPISGMVGWAPGSYNKSDYADNGGIGEPSPFQYGWSAALVLELLYERYQRERYLMPHEKHIDGFIHELRSFPDDKLVARIETGCVRQPYLEMESLDGKPIRESVNFIIRLSDPYGEIDSPKIKLVLPQFLPGLSFLSAIDKEGKREKLESRHDEYYEIELTRQEMGNIDHFQVVDLAHIGAGADGSGDSGCQQVQGTFSSFYRLLGLLLLVFVIRRALKVRQ